MAEDWARVAGAINRRVAELGWRQRELIERSHVSKAIVREIQHNTVQRRRSARTLEALSLALGWHPEHLSAVLSGHTPPAVDESESDSSNDVPTRLTTIESHLLEIRDQLAAINTNLSNLTIVINDTNQTTK